MIRGDYVCFSPLRQKPEYSAANEKGRDEPGLCNPDVESPYLASGSGTGVSASERR